MSADRQLLRFGECLVRWACQRLPQDIRDERYREWTAELPAILHDPQVQFAPHRAVRMLGYAVDTFRGAALTNVGARWQMPGVTAALSLSLFGGLALVAWDAWNIVRAPGHGLNYLLLAWSLLAVAYPVSMLMRSAARVTTVILIGQCLPCVAFSTWDAAHSPGDWVNYFVAALLLALLVAWWRVARWARTRRA